MSLRIRLLVGLAVLVLAAVASSGWLVLRVARAHLEEAEARAAQALGERVAAMLAKSGDRAAVVEAVRALETGGVAGEVAAVDGRGVTLVGEPDGALRGAAGGPAFVIRKSPALYVYVPLHGAGGALRLRLHDRDGVSQALSRAQNLLWAVTLVDAALVLAFGALFIRRVIGPLEALAGSARRVAAGDLDVPAVASETRGDEIARLTDDFNRMTKNLRAQRDRLVAQEKLASVGQLAAGVAHEVGNPLAAILGYSELLLKDAPNGSEVRDSLERIRRETERIRAIVADLLDYAKPPKGDVEPVSLHECVEAARSLLRPQARFREVSVDNRVDPALPAAAANGNRVIQILINLFLNAADAMGGKGTITAEGAINAAVELRVRDSGPGISVDDRARIFDPFFTTKDPGAGTGLGLSISRSIAEAYGGDLSLEERSTFVLTLPKA